MVEPAAKRVVGRTSVIADPVLLVHGAKLILTHVPRRHACIRVNAITSIMISVANALSN